MQYITPGGQYYTLYKNMLEQPHLLIAGATGSGKSVIINGLIYTALFNSPAKAQFILIDPKRVELSRYKQLPHVLRYASEPADRVEALQYAGNVMDARFKAMERKGLTMSEDADIYVIIDELADLMLTQKKAAAPLLQHLSQLGRAARVHVIAATQCPLREVIPTAIKVNFDARVGLRTRSAQDSRNILGIKGCELLPRYGQGYYMTPDETTLYNIPMYPPEKIADMIAYWKPRRQAEKRNFLLFRR